MSSSIALLFQHSFKVQLLCFTFLKNNITYSFFRGKFSKKGISKYVSILWCKWKVAHDARSILVKKCGSEDIHAL